MINKEKLMLLAMVSMLLPGALPDLAAAEGLRRLPEQKSEPIINDANSLADSDVELELGEEVS